MDDPDVPATDGPGPRFFESPDGYRHCYQLFGDPDGFPLLYCHGFPGSRLDARLVHDGARALGLCVIAIDRPGFGGSDLQPGRRMADWPMQVDYLMDALGHRRFSVLGISGGAPYAMLLAQHLHQCTERLGIVCGLGSLVESGSERGMGRSQQALIRFARAFPRAALPLYRYLVGSFLGRFPSASLGILTGGAPPADRLILANPEVRSIFVEAAREAFAQGGRGPAWELYLFTHRWQADPAAVPVQTFLWHGEVDATVPVAMGRTHARRIPHCEAVFYPDEGHFSLPVSKLEIILSTLLP